MWLWFNEASADKEVFDSGNEALENEIADALNKFKWEQEEIQRDSLENMSKDQLTNFLSNRFFPEGVTSDKLSYSSISNAWKVLDYSVKAALQFWTQEHPNDDVRYKCDDKFNLILEGGKPVKVNDDSWKTAEQILIGRWWIDIEATSKFDNNIVRVLQDKIWATVDWKPWAQTISLIISALGGDITNIWEKVNNHYKWNEKFMAFSNITIAYWPDDNKVTTTFKYNPSLEVVTWNWMTIDGKPVDLNSNPPVCEWYTFENGRIMKNGSGNTVPVEQNEYEWSINNPKSLYNVVKDEMKKSDLNIENMSNTTIDIRPHIKEDTTFSNFRNNSLVNIYNVDRFLDYNKIDLIVWSNRVTIDLKSVIDKKWEFNKSNRERILWEKKSELREQAIASNLTETISNSKNSFSFSEIFDENLLNSLNLVEKSNLNWYLWSLDPKKIILRNIRQSWTNIVFDILDRGFHSFYTTYNDYNKNISIDSKKIENWNGELDDGKFKEELRTVIMNNVLPKYLW